MLVSPQSTVATRRHQDRPAGRRRRFRSGGIPRKAAAAVAVCLLATLGLVAGCNERSRPPDPPRSSPERPGGTFRMAQVAPQGLDPARVDDSYEASLVNQIYDGLLSYDANFNLQPSLAVSWHIARDGLTYTFDLKRGVRFHDGSELTADDVAFSIQRVFRLPPEEAPLAREYLGHVLGVESFARGETDSVAGLEVLGPASIRITLARPYASFLAVMASEIARIVPRAYVEREGDDVLVRRPVGSGPFRLREWIEGKQIVLERFEHYHQEPAFLERLEFATPGGAVRQEAIERFRAGQLTGVELTSSGFQASEELGDAVIHRRQELSLTYVGFDCTRPPFDDPRLRRAFALALDRDRLPGLVDGGRVPSNGILPPGFPGYTPREKVPAGDPQAAARLLEQAGHPGGEGLPVIRHGIARQSTAEVAIVEAIRRQIARVGFVLEIEPVEWEEFDARLRRHEFNSFTLTWVADLPDPDSFFYPLFHSQGAANYMGYSNVVVDTGLEAAREGRTAGTRIEAYREMELLILADLPVLPLNHTTAVFAVRPEVRDFHLSAMGVGNLPLRQVWLADLQLATNGEAR